MIAAKSRTTVVFMLLVAAALPFLLVGKEVLLSVASPLFWLVGYPMMVAFAIAVIAPRTKSKPSLAAGGGVQSSDKRDTRNMFEANNNPIYADQIDNDFHRA